MKVAAIHFRPDVTQIVEGTIKKNVLHVQYTTTMRPIISTLLNFRQDAIGEYLKELKEKLHYKNAAVHFGLPDDFFKKIDCKERDHVSPDEWDKVVNDWMYQSLQVEKEDYHIITPLHFPHDSKSIITGIAIRSTYIDAIYHAAIAADIEIVSIEPSSYAILRLLNQWDQEHCIMEVWEKSTTLIGYSDIRGMFKINVSQGWSYFLEDIGSSELYATISKHDYTAYTTYKIANTNIPIYLVSDKKGELRSLLLKSEIAFRLREPVIPEDFITSKIAEEELLEYAIPLGLALAPLHERMIEYADSKR